MSSPRSSMEALQRLAQAQRGASPMLGGRSLSSPHPAVNLGSSGACPRAVGHWDV